MRVSPLLQRRALFAKVSGFFVLLTALLMLSVAHANAEAPTGSASMAPESGNIGNFIWREPRYAFNGIQDAGEPGLAFTPVNLYDAGGTLISVTNASAVGIYNFNIPTNGTYYIEVPNPSNVTANPVLAGLVRSPQNQGGNPALDSDVDTSDGYVLINVNGNNDTIDAAFHDSNASNTYCTGRQLTFTDWAGTFTLPQSNPAFGTLTNVYFRASVGSAQDARITNTGNGSQTFSYEGGALALLNMPYGSPPPVLSVSTGRLIPNITLGSGQSMTFDDLVDYRFTDYSVPAPTRPSYSGTGTFNITATAQGRSAFTGGGNLQATASTEAYVSICVTYLYQVPLAVVMNSIDAQCRATTNDVQVTWETASEANALGFNVLRGTDANTPGEQVNNELIAAQAPGGGGAAYEWIDSTVPGSGDYYYWIQAVDAQGNNSLHGPVSVSYPCAPTSVTLGTIAVQPKPLSATPLWFALIGAGVVIVAGATRRKQ